VGLTKSRSDAARQPSAASYQSLSEGLFPSSDQIDDGDLTLSIVKGSSHQHLSRLLWNQRSTRTTSTHTDQSQIRVSSQKSWSELLLPGSVSIPSLSCQSAYWANHSTETVITAVYGEIVRSVLLTQEICALWCCLTWVPCLTQWMTIRCAQYFMNGSALAELCWIVAETTCLIAHRLSRLGYSYRKPTTFGAVCRDPKGLSRVQRGKSSESVQCVMLKACDACADMGQL